jgi:hypothetical protein
MQNQKIKKYKLVYSTARQYISQLPLSLPIIIPIQVSLLKRLPEFVIVLKYG